MIIYESGLLGLGSLKRVHGSAAYKVIIPSLLSTGVLFGYHSMDDIQNTADSNNNVIQHPYTIGAFLAFFSLLLTFRLNFAYSRYWEGATAIHNMLSRWLDCGMTTAAFHYQSAQYNTIVPPTFGSIATKYNCMISSSKIIGRDRNYPGPASFEIASEAIQQMAAAEAAATTTSAAAATSGDNFNSTNNNEHMQHDESPKLFAVFRRNWSNKNKNINNNINNNNNSNINSNLKTTSNNAHKPTTTTNCNSTTTAIINANKTTDRRNGRTTTATKATPLTLLNKRPNIVQRTASAQSTPKSINRSYQQKLSSSITVDNNLHRNKNYDDNDDASSPAIPIPVRFQDRLQHQQQQLRTSISFSSLSLATNDTKKQEPDSNNSFNSSLRPSTSAPSLIEGFYDNNTNNNNNKNNNECTKHKTKHQRHASKLPTPSLFLQELAHLLSLLSAVAMSTLRNDIEGAESPINGYIPGAPWPPVDSFFLDSETRAAYNEASVVSELFFYMLGLSRSTRHRTLYNAARPFGVLGGVSDEEIRLLQSARGPYAKVALVSMWLQEFISREHLHGSTGPVASTIITRVYQMLGDGISGYNQARKIAYVPYPFPSAQIASFFSLALIFILPLLYESYVTKFWFAAIMNFTTVLCFLGLHEVARELEAPFQNVPNDLPLTTFQAQFNEALLAMYAGFHPDSWWTVNDDNINNKHDEDDHHKQQLEKDQGQH